MACRLPGRRDSQLRPSGAGTPVIRVIDTYIRIILVFSWIFSGFLARYTSGRWPDWSAFFEMQSLGASYCAGTWPDHVPWTTLWALRIIIAMQWSGTIIGAIGVTFGISTIWE